MENRVYNPQNFPINYLKGKIGVYQIRNVVNNHIYIGSANNLYRRKREHWHALSENKHVNLYLQRAFNHYGMDKFKFEVIEFCDALNQFNIEQYWIDRFLGIGCYNISIYATHPNVKRRYGKDNHCSKAVVCLEDGIMYDSIREAAQKTVSSVSGITYCCYKTGKTSNGLHWVFKEDYNKMTEETRLDYILSNNSSEPVVCLETKKVYLSVLDACKDTNADEDGIY